MKKTRVMLIEDSRTVRQFLEYMIDRDPRLMVVSSVESAEAGLRELKRIVPDVISMDIHLPGMNGFEATRRIMEEQPTPIVVVTGTLQFLELQSSMKALKAGALAVVEKPVGTTHEDYKVLAEQLCTQLAIMSQVKVIRQRFNRQTGSRPKEIGQPATRKHSGHPLQSAQMIGIVASTGGPRALQEILGLLPADFPVPIVLVQHITANFHEGFVEWLNQTCRLSVVSAKHLQIPEAGYVYVAPPEFHLETDGRRLLLQRGDTVSSQRPSGTVLLQSMAKSLKQSALGIVLTGMGDDGALGLLDIRQMGGYTIAEDESTAVVYGMPAACARLGAVCEQLPLEEIGLRMREAAHTLEEVR